MKTAYLLAFTVALTCLLSGFTAQAKPKCGKNKFQDLEYAYCVDAPKKSAQALDVIYYLHGAGGNEKELFKSREYAKLQAAWRKIHYAQPAVISISFGPFWFLSDFGQNLNDVFVKQVMPAMETKITRKSGKRMLLGASLGGYNSTLLTERGEGGFQRVALFCPALTTIGPFATPAEVDGYVQRNAPWAKRDQVQTVLDAVRSVFPSPADWERNNPFALLTQLNTGTPPIFISADSHDELGLYEGATTFYQALTEKGLEAYFVAVPNGTHCQSSPAGIETLAKFFAGAPKEELDKVVEKANAEKQSFSLE